MDVNSITKKEFWYMTIAGFCSMCIEGLMDGIKSVTFPLIRDHFNASYEEYGILNSMVNIGYVIFASICSILIPYIGFKNTMIVSAISGIVLSIFMAYSPSFLWCIIIQFIFGICLGFGDIPPQTLGTIIFQKNPGYYMALVNAFYGIGCLVSPLIAGFVLEYIPYGYKGVYLIMIIPVLFLGLIIIFSKFKVYSLINQNQTSLVDTQIESQEENNNLTVINTSLNLEENSLQETLIISNNQNKKSSCCQIKNPVIQAALDPKVILFIITLTMLTLVERSGMNWSGQYIEDVLHLDPAKEGALFNTLYFSLYTITRLFGGILTDKLGALQIIFYTLCITMILLLIGFLTNVVGIWIICSTGVFVALFWPSFIIVVTEYFEEKGTATVGVILPLQSFVAALFQPLLGCFNTWWGPASAFQFTFVFACIALLLLCVISYLIHKKKNDLHSSL